MKRSSVRSPSITSQESFSAVMITDLIADVNVNPEFEDSTKSTKEETNLGFDGHMDGDIKRQLSEDVDSTKINGTEISKGVILNAVQFNANDYKKTFDEKPMQLTAPMPIPKVSQPTPAPKGFKDMTLKRKVAFGFSFFPSIFFILCFAVILPCNVPKPCVEEAWTVELNNTDPTSSIKLSSAIMLTALKDDKNVLLKLEKNDGKVKEIELPFSPAYLKCGKIMFENQTDCIIMDTSGEVYTFNDSHSKFLWSASETKDLPSSPVILSGCSDKLQDIGVAVSSTSIKILHGGNKVSDFKVSFCDSIPVKLMPWKINGSSDIIFVCDKAGEDRLVRVPSSAWCALTQNFKNEPLVLLSGPIDSIKESIFQPLKDDSLVLWSGDEVSLINSHGELLWKVSNLSLPEENRFILYGNLLENQKLLAIFGSNLTFGLKVILLKPSDGNIVKTLNFKNTEAHEVIQVEGKKRDFAILLLKKTALDSMTAAFTQISDISSTIVSLLSNEKLDDGSSIPTTEELAILDFEGNLDSVKEKDEKNSNLKSTIAATSDKQTGTLSVYLLSTSYNPKMDVAYVKNIIIRNWDKTKKSKCML